MLVEARKAGEGWDKSVKFEAATRAGAIRTAAHRLGLRGPLSAAERVGAHQWRAYAGGALFHVIITGETGPAPAWTWEAYWATVLGIGDGAAIVREHGLTLDGLDEWLGHAEEEAWAIGGHDGPVPDEWKAFHSRALEELEDARRAELAEHAGDAECIHCGDTHASFGLLPLCPRCTRRHYRALRSGS